MSYIVVYLRADGSSGVEECADLDLAVVAAERLRNVDSVERPRIFKTEEVTYDFKPYYRVEVTTADDAGLGAAVGHVAPAPTPVMATTPIDPVAAVVEEPVEEPAEVVADVAASTTDAEDVPAEASAAEEQPPAPPVMPDAPDATAVADDVPSKKGLFDSAPVESTPDPVVETPDVAPLVEDVKDSVPPRRGLFGR